MSCLMLSVIFLLHLSYNLGSAHATPEEYENRGFILTKHETFSVHTTPEKFENVTNTCTITYIIIWQGKSERSDWFFLTGRDFAIWKRS